MSLFFLPIALSLFLTAILGGGIRVREYRLAGAGFGARLVAAASLGVLFVLMSKVQSHKPVVRIPVPQQLMSWKQTCGSVPVQGEYWWPVLGSAEALAIVRQRFCGDAFLTSEGFTQAASFSSSQQAATFAAELSQESGYEFRVGQPHYIPLP